MWQHSLMQLKREATPQRFAETLQSMGDIFWWPAGKFYVITGHKLAQQALRSDDLTCDRSSFFVSRMPDMNLALIQDFFAVVSKMMVMSDNTEHKVRRRVCYEGFTSASLDKLKPLIAQTVAEGILKLQQDGQIDFVEDLAKRIPSIALADFFAIPDQEREQFYHWSNNMTQFFGGDSAYQDEDGMIVNDSASNLKAYFVDLIAQRRKHPSNDFLSVLLANQQHFELSDDEIISQAVMMLVAGQVTTTDQLCNNLYTLLTDSSQAADIRHQQQALSPLIEELNRLDPAVTFIFRVVKNETQLGDQTLPAGSVIFISAHAVNRDKRTFKMPHAINIDHASNKHMSYGYGSHYCLGAKLARIEMTHCLAELFKHFPTCRFDQNNWPVRKHHSLSFSGFESMPLLAC